MYLFFYYAIIIYMKMKRYYIENELSENTQVVLDGDEFHHLKDVMRQRPNDEVVLFNGKGFDAIARIIRIDKKSAVLEVEKIVENDIMPNVNVTLFQAVCKGEKLSLITQKITELGARGLEVFYSKYTDIKDRTGKLDKLSKVSISACKQCGRSDELKISGVDDFNSMVEKAKKLDKVYVAYENSTGKTLYDCISKNANLANIGVIIGAEGGFSPEEIAILEKNNFEIVSLGKSILRTETASISSVALIVFVLGGKR